MHRNKMKIIITFLILNSLTISSCLENSISKINSQEIVSIKTETNQKLSVTMEIFSGRPNPVWLLTPEESKEFISKLNKLTLTEAKTLSEGLGYMGILFENLETSEGKINIKFQKGIVEIRKPDGTKKYLLDKDRLVEEWLFKSAKGRVKDQYGEIDIDKLFEQVWIDKTPELTASPSTQPMAQ